MKHIRSNEKAIVHVVPTGERWLARRQTSAANAEGFRSALGEMGDSRAEQLADRLDSIAAGYDIAGAKIVASEDDDGALTFEALTPEFRLFFAQGSTEDDSGWGLALHRTAGRMISTGPLDMDLSTVFRFVFPTKRCIRARASAESESQAGFTLRTG